MNGFDPYTIIFLVLAVVIILRLRSVLGRRTGNERPPFDPFRRNEPARGTNDKVIALPQRTGRDVEPPVSVPNPTAEAEVKVKEVAAPGSPLEASLKALLAADPTFDPKGFIEGAKGAYEMIVTAFAEGDRKTLRNLLSRDVYDGFVAAISERESRQETINFKFVGISKAELTDAAVKGRTAHVTVRFNSELISATKDKDGKVIDGDEVKVSEVTDIWTFAHDIGARDPNWKLVATESVE